ncbi:hypothetical protein GCM10022255_085090 [Dactylosporangium darangshiense]|uniref:Uncharacterized protein n=1 Tax=Dactylosporangium darangshiense TaxID=579108 RepID=A0ABP8DML0_9ACTN
MHDEHGAERDRPQAIQGRLVPQRHHAGRLPGGGLTKPGLALPTSKGVYPHQKTDAMIT